MEHPCDICNERIAKHTVAVMYHGSEYGIPCYWKVICDHCAKRQELEDGWHKMSNNRMKFVQFFYVPDGGSSSKSKAARFDVCPATCDDCRQDYFEGSMFRTSDEEDIYCKHCAENHKDRYL